MAKLIVQNLGSLTVNVSASQTVLQAIQAIGLDWMHACGAKGRCTTCRVEIISGMENLSPETAPELKYREAGRLRKTERLTCQITVLQDELKVKLQNQVKLQHLKYTK